MIAWAWGDEKNKERGFNPYPRTNILSPEHGGQGTGKDRILCYDPSGRYKDFEIAWRSLPKRQRECVYTRFVIGGVVDEESGKPLTKRQIAEVVGCSYDSFKANLSRALKRIKYLIS